MPRPGDTLRKRLAERVGDYNSQREMAERIGVTKETLNRWLRGAMPNPRLSELESIGSELGLSMAQLLDDGAPAQRERVVVKTDPRVTAALQKLLDVFAEVATIAKSLPPDAQPPAVGAKR